MRKKKSNVLIIVIVLLVGIFLVYSYVLTDKDSEVIKDNKETEIDNKNNSNTKDNNDNSSKEINNNDDVSNNSTNNTESFYNQEGEKVEVTGEKIVGAEGFAGSSNHKYILRDGTLYYKNISSNEDEVILATGIKDLFLERHEVIAILGENGKVVTENNYITYR